MTEWRADPFFQVPLTHVRTSEGDVALPILYFDCSNFVAMFWVDHRSAQTLAVRDGLEAVRFGNGKTLAVVVFYAYRQTAIGSYNEVGLAIAAAPPGAAPPRSPLLSILRSPDKNRVGFNVLDLPVTTPAACSAGREIWGYPKFVTPIGFALNGRDFLGTVKDPEGEGDLLTLSGRTGIGAPAPLLDPVTFSRNEGKLLRTAVVTRGGGMARLPGTIRLRVSASSHRMANDLRALGLDGARPALVTHTDRLQLRLNAGAVVG